MVCIPLQRCPCSRMSHNAPHQQGTHASLLPPQPPTREMTGTFQQLTNSYHYFILCFHRWNCDGEVRRLLPLEAADAGAAASILVTVCHLGSDKLIGLRNRK